MNDAVPASADESVLAVRLREFSRQPVAEQARLITKVEDLVTFAIKPLVAAERVVLQAADGFVVVVLSGPEQGLQVAKRAQLAAADLPLCIALNYGAVKFMPGMDEGPELVGDGIAAAVTLASLATRGRVMASRSFRDALSVAAPSSAEEFRQAGAFTDDSVRSHELFVHEPGRAAVRGRRWVLIGTLAVLGIVAAGIATRVVRKSMQRPAILQLDITPRGEVFVDDQPMGRSPPLTRMEVEPGPHVIEVRNSPNPPLRLEVHLRPGQELKVAHSFASPKKREKKDESLMESIRRRLGL